jgi:DNA-binding GntR family transcriptional regulator
MPRRRHPQEALPALRPVDPSSPTPRSTQAMESLLEAINAGSIGPLLPNQHALAAQLGVSLSTVRQAIETLKAEGRLVPVPSVGTYVQREATGRSQPAAALNCDDLRSLSAAALHSVLMASGEAGAPPRSRALAGKGCWHWQWRLLGNELKPCAVVDAWGVTSLARGAERVASPFDLLAGATGRLARLEQVVQAAAPTAAERKALALGPANGILLLSSFGYGPRGEQVLYVEWAVGPDMALTSTLDWGEG